MTMKKLNIHEAKTHLSKELARLQPGDVIIICKNNEPVAELRALPRRQSQRRPWGIDKGLFRVPDDFNAPLPAEELALWEK
jgi:antitoxin (DNA-binding transcriptional repressor) of toxin-antitoxin stability system